MTKKPEEEGESTSPDRIKELEYRIASVEEQLTKLLKPTEQALSAVDLTCPPDELAALTTRVDDLTTRMTALESMVMPIKPPAS